MYNQSINEWYHERLPQSINQSMISRKIATINQSINDITKDCHNQSINEWYHERLPQLWLVFPTGAGAIRMSADEATREASNWICSRRAACRAARSSTKWWWEKSWEECPKKKKKGGGKDFFNEIIVFVSERVMQWRNDVRYVVL